MIEMFRITAPIEGYEGEISGARFIEGVAETNDAAAVAYCRRRGYQVDEIDDPEPDHGDPEADEPGRPNVNASKADWVAYAVSQGAGEADAERATKNELIELYGN